jgi:hypothetical protein
MPQHNSTWIVVADAGRARILYLERPGSPVHRVFEEDDASARRFEVADVVNEMAARRGFDRLILVASRRTLGMLREALSDEARACITAECEQNLSRYSDEVVLRVLAERCKDVLAVADDEEVEAAEEAETEARVEDDAGAEDGFQGSMQ